MYTEFKEILEKALKEVNVNLGQEEIYRLYQYYKKLIETNQYINLTTITEVKEVIYKHFIDSLALVYQNPSLLQNVKKILDLGTGAGFPGMVLAIACKDIQFTLVDSLNKRIQFIKEVSDILKLSNVTAIHSRAEDLARNKIYRENFDIVVSRAVANLSTLSEYCIPFVSCGGYFIAYKVEKKEELKEAEKSIKILGGKLDKVQCFQLQYESAKRSLIYIRKNEFTPKKYPRKAGIPSKEPL